MDGDGDPADPADPDGGMAPSAAFFGLWPKFAEQERSGEGPMFVEQGRS